MGRRHTRSGSFRQWVSRYETVLYSGCGSRCYSKNILISSANHALSIVHPMLKVRSLAEGSKKAKAKAFRSAGTVLFFSAEDVFLFSFIFTLGCCCFPEFIQPVKERPKTDCAVAQRMVTRALGLQKRSRVQRYWGKSQTLTRDLNKNLFILCSYKSQESQFWHPSIFIYLKMQCRQA